jgi:hypothetical protein
MWVKIRASSQSFVYANEQIVSLGLTGREELLLGHFLRLVMMRDRSSIINNAGSRSDCHGMLKDDP